MANPWRHDWISREFKRLMRKSGAGGGKVPSLKAMASTMVTHLHEEGVPLEVISSVTGHASGATTRDHYLHVTAERTVAPSQRSPSTSRLDVVTAKVTSGSPRRETASGVI